jgi:5-methylcytosine-specific restriction endonuclease McrA
VRPCLGCGELVDTGSRCPDCRLPRPSRPSTAHPALRTARWTNLSKQLRKRSPFCEECGSTQNLCVDHIIAVSEDESLIFDKANLRVLCRLHNQRKKDNVTDAERQRVHDAIAARKRRASAV